MRYIGSDAYKINDKLRNDAKLTPNETEFIKNLDRALEKVPVYSGDVSRSVWFANNEQLKDFIDSFEVGTKRTFKEFLSTTAGEIYNPDAQVQIFVFDSKKGRNLTEYNKEEQEVLYQRGTEFAVVKKDEVDGRWFILLKEIEDEKQAVPK